MQLEHFFSTSVTDNVGGLFSVAGSFGTFDARTPISRTGDTFTAEVGGVTMTATFEYRPSGALIRRDFLKNNNAQSVTVRRLLSRFAFEGYSYDVYTQYSSWQNESLGAWQPLHTGVTAAALGMRACDGATPMMALCNRQSGKIDVFHLVTNAAWKIAVRRTPDVLKSDATVLEVGFDDSDLSLTVAPGETVDLPAVIFYTTTDRLSLGSEILHGVCRELYPRKRLPFIYNSWFLNFDVIDVAEIRRQIKACAELGVEYFVIDAGWFGKGKPWWQSIGDWVENTEGAFFGRLASVADEVRAAGMKFGLWLEPERALATADSTAEHPEFYFENNGNYFLDFANDAARAYITKVACDLIDRYGIEYLKFDFNATVGLDPRHEAFYRYNKGQKDFVRAVRAHKRDLYITGCASGGYRMTLSQADVFDSFWISDNQGPTEGLDIYAGTVLRMPPWLIEKWNAQSFTPPLPLYGSKEPVRRPLYCNDGTWNYLITVNESFGTEFLAGGPIGFTGSPADYTEDYKERIKAYLAAYRKEEDFYLNASVKLLADEGGIRVLTFRSPDGEKTVVRIFSRLIFQNTFTFYPDADADAVYLVDGVERAGADLLESGVTLKDMTDNDCKTVTILRK